MDFKTEILRVIRENEQVIAPFLGIRSHRTHAFLGGSHRIMQPVFSRRGEDSRVQCILAQVYSQCYPAQAMATPNTNELLPFFECYRLDCVYLSPRSYDKNGFPNIWNNEWLIEVENDLTEFAMTMRGLLDIVGMNRLGIFFADTPDLKVLTDEFRISWDDYASHYGFAGDLNLQAIFFPESYSSWDTYAKASASYLWDASSRTFVNT